MFDTNGQLFFPGTTRTAPAAQPRAPVLGPGVRRRHDRGQRQGLALPRSRAEALPLPVPERLERAHLRDVPRQPEDQVNGPPMWVIGTDGGYLDTPVKIDPNAAKPAPQRLVIMPGERYEVIIDFTGQPVGTRLLADEHRQGAVSGRRRPRRGRRRPDRAVPGEVRRPKTRGSSLRPGRRRRFEASPGPRRRRIAVAPVNLHRTLATGISPQKTRQLTLNEVMGMPMTTVNPVNGNPMTAYPGGPLEILVNNTRYSGESARNTPERPPPSTTSFSWRRGAPYSEMPTEGDDRALGDREPYRRRAPHPSAPGAVPAHEPPGVRRPEVQRGLRPRLPRGCSAGRYGLRPGFRPPLGMRHLQRREPSRRRSTAPSQLHRRGALGLRRWSAGTRTSRRS